jgi:hypothetical protein
MAQGVDPKFKPQFPPPKKPKTNNNKKNQIYFSCGEFYINIVRIIATIVNWI